MRASLCVLVLLTVALLAACGGDDNGGDRTTGPTAEATLTVDDATYFEELASALAMANESLTTLDDLQAEASFSEYGDAYEQFMADRDAAVHAITPPEPLTDQHAALGTATGDTLEFGRQLNSDIQADPPQTDAEFTDLFYELDGATLTQRFRDACRALQLIATNNGIEADLQCLR